MLIPVEFYKFSHRARLYQMGASSATMNFPPPDALAPNTVMLKGSGRERTSVPFPSRSSIRPEFQPVSALRVAVKP